ncbi:MAG: DUF4340 domain-containing protein [Bdellovibrio sp.]|nr:DUF4340 domain-containing protein [Bdellovibrio sp.]
MKIKGRGILVLCLLLFGGYAIYDYFQDQKKEEKNMEQARLLTVNFEQVDSFEIQKGNQKTRLKRTVDGWELVEPLQDLADNSVAEDFVKNVVPERVIEVAKEGEGIDWAVYGLDKPLGTITFKTTAGAQNVFEISEKKNFEDNVFARRDQEAKVLVLNSVWQNRVNKTALDFRDRRFLRHKIASVDELKLKNAKGAWELKRVDGQWTAVGKKEFKLDQNKVREILTAISDAKAAEIFDSKAKLPNLKNLFTLELMISDKKWTAEVGQASDLLIYAKVSEPAFQLKMEAGALDKFIKMTLEDLKEQPPKMKEEETQAMTAEKKDQK